jgi:hypothetical protein
MESLVLKYSQGNNARDQHVSQSLLNHARRGPTYAAGMLQTMGTRTYPGCLSSAWHDKRFEVSNGDGAHDVVATGADIIEALTDWALEPALGFVTVPGTGNEYFILPVAGEAGAELLQPCTAPQKSAPKKKAAKKASARDDVRTIGAYKAAKSQLGPYVTPAVLTSVALVVTALKELPPSQRPQKIIGDLKNTRFVAGFYLLDTPLRLLAKVSQVCRCLNSGCSLSLPSLAIDIKVTSTAVLDLYRSCI